eukprot:CAMPEP_0177572264 /NCGR_PEP_ID=MMETSP0369-20130122/77865_1 /TAXON_ID=447022 ORGANISM="Scrippsiella hangoei-like, Strain SHHI-4" /NCGR_SAMPLE_ID=MMETSP0369 /ASSEMBLY_ACC=CAM_ASM_000364 /LENGTH=168 /DNA_ID=CAMNT_0019060225 /DNA_START=508 /DNA_END=1014 /DNA_ORIENTATION=-
MSPDGKRQLEDKNGANVYKESRHKDCHSKFARLGLNPPANKLNAENRIQRGLRSASSKSGSVRLWSTNETKLDCINNEGLLTMHKNKRLQAPSGGEACAIAFAFAVALKKIVSGFACLSANNFSIFSSMACSFTSKAKLAICVRDSSAAIFSFSNAASLSMSSLFCTS